MEFKEFRKRILASTVTDVQNDGCCNVVRFVLGNGESLEIEAGNVEFNIPNLEYLEVKK